jgi:hypothetical protein
MMQHATVFGLRLTSEFPIAGLVPCTERGEPDVRVHRGWSPALCALAKAAEPACASPFMTPDGVPASTLAHCADGAHSVVAIAGGPRVIVDRDGRDIWVDTGAGADGGSAADGNASVDDALVASYLLGPILGLALRRRGVVCLHASAVELPCGTVAFAGLEGAGKSTVAAALAMRGHRVVTDDLVALVDCGDTMLVQPGAAFLRVRPGAIAAEAARLGRSADWVPAPDGNHHDLPLVPPRYHLATTASPVRAIYYLRPRAGHLHRPAAPESPTSVVEPMAGADALMALVGDTWATRWLDGLGRAAEFDVLARLVSQVVLRRVTIAPNERVRRGRGHPARSLAALVNAIEHDAAQWPTALAGSVRA